MVGIVAAVVIVIIMVFGILWWKGCLGKKSSSTKGDYKEITPKQNFVETRGFFMYNDRVRELTRKLLASNI